MITNLIYIYTKALFLTPPISCSESALRWTLTPPISCSESAL